MPSSGSQIITNPYPVAKSLDALGLKTGNETTGLREGNSDLTADVVWKLDNGTWKQFFVYNDGFGGDGEPIAWNTAGSSADQGGIQVDAGEAVLVIRKAGAFNWQPVKPNL